MIGTLLAFAGLSVLLAITPGPDTFLVLRSAVRAGSKAGLLTATGAAIGSMAWAGAAAVGLAALLERWSAGYHLIRVLGALYLIYLGVRTLAQRAHTGEIVLSHGSTENRLSGWYAYRMGLLSAVLNPKIGLFFLAVAPQFLPQGHSVVVMTLVLGVIDAVVAMAWLAVVAIGASQLMRWLARPRVNHIFELSTGAALTGLGVATLATGN